MAHESEITAVAAAGASEDAVFADAPKVVKPAAQFDRPRFLEAITIDFVVTDKGHRKRRA
jgi:hypothetical protein